MPRESYLNRALFLYAFLTLKLGENNDKLPELYNAKRTEYLYMCY